MQSTPPKRYQQLQPEDRVTLASLTQQKYSVRAMAQVLGRSPSTISRELRRNAQPTGYASVPARNCAQRRRRQSRPEIKRMRAGNPTLTAPCGHGWCSDVGGLPAVRQELVNATGHVRG